MIARRKKGSEKSIIVSPSLFSVYTEPLFSVYAEPIT